MAREPQQSMASLWSKLKCRQPLQEMTCEQTKLSIGHMHFQLPCLLSGLGFSSGISALSFLSFHCCGFLLSLQDFVSLQFIPEGTDLRPILPVLARVFDRCAPFGSFLAGSTEERVDKIHSLKSSHRSRGGSWEGLLQLGHTQVWCVRWKTS